MNAVILLCAICAADPADDVDVRAYVREAEKQYPEEIKSINSKLAAFEAAEVRPETVVSALKKLRSRLLEQPEAFVPSMTDHSPGEWVSDDREQYVVVFQVIDEDTMLVKPVYDRRFDGSFRWEIVRLVGVSTANAANGDRFDMGDHVVYKADGTTTYSTVNGATNTVHVVRKWDASGATKAWGQIAAKIAADQAHSIAEADRARSERNVADAKKITDPSSDPDTLAYIAAAEHPSLCDESGRPKMTDTSPGVWRNHTSSVVVLQIIDDHTLITYDRGMSRIDRIERTIFDGWQMVWIEGVSTRGLVDGVRFDPSKYVFKSAGTKTYETKDLGEKTVHRLQAWDSTQADQILRQRSSATAAKKAEADAARRLRDEQAARKSRQRMWSDATGTFTVEAEYVDYADGNVLLRRFDNDKTIRIPLAKLSKDDRDWVHIRIAPIRKTGAKVNRKPKPKDGGVMSEDYERMFDR